MYIVSACLLGENCRYDGKNSLTKWVDELKKEHTVCMVCPEVLGKLPVPRAKAEIKDDKVMDENGRDVTEIFADGAKIAYTRAVAAALSINEEIEGAILKSKSPSCGRDFVYDGTFSGTLINGEGYFAKLLREHGIKIYTEKENFNDKL